MQPVKLGLLISLLFIAGEHAPVCSCEPPTPLVEKFDQTTSLSVNSACPGSTERENMELAANALLKVDIDGDCKTDYLMQVARSKEVAIPSNSSIKFSMLVRVYSSAVELYVGRLETEAVSLYSPASSSQEEHSKPLAVLQEEEQIKPLVILKAEMTFSKS
jgi:hypothetical protein